MPLYKATKPIQQRIMVGIPMTGLLRSEWVMARYSQVVPCNWGQVDVIRWLDPHSPLGYAVADARNIVADEALKGNFEWLFFIDHDVVLPMGTILKINEYMIKPQAPIVSGLYFTKSVPSEPLIYRKRGTGYYANWKMGDKVWVDGTPMGCTLIDVKLLKAVADEVEEYIVEGRKVKRIFKLHQGPYSILKLMAGITHPGLRTWNFAQGSLSMDWLRKQGMRQKNIHLFWTLLYFVNI